MVWIEKAQRDVFRSNEVICLETKVLFKSWGVWHGECVKHGVFRLLMGICWQEDIYCLRAAQSGQEGLVLGISLAFWTDFYVRQYPLVISLVRKDTNVNIFVFISSFKNKYFGFHDFLGGRVSLNHETACLLETLLCLIKWIILHSFPFGQVLLELYQTSGAHFSPVNLLCSLLWPTHTEPSFLSLGCHMFAAIIIFHKRWYLACCAYAVIYCL